MAEKFELPKESIYGKYSLSKDIAAGVSLIVTVASLRIVLVAEQIANRFMSEAGKIRGDKENGNYLGYPEFDGRASIPMYELATKGYIEIYNAQIKEHFNNLVKMIPDYLRERGILSPKHIITLAEKVEAEHKDFLYEMRYATKKELINSAEMIVAYNKITEFFQAPDFSTEKLGVILLTPELLELTYDYLAENKLDVTAENIEKFTQHLKENCSEMVFDEQSIESIIKEQVNGFERELKLAKPNYVQTVLLKFQTPDGIKEFDMQLKEFESYYSDEMKQKFAEHNMLDFPSKDYFGDKYSELHEKVLLKRFNENLVENFNNFSAQFKGEVALTVNGLSTEKIRQSSYDDLVNHYSLKQYISANYHNPEKHIEKIKLYIKGTQDMFKEVQIFVKSISDNTEEKAVEKTQTEIESLTAKEVEDYVEDAEM